MEALPATIAFAEVNSIFSISPEFADSSFSAGNSTFTILKKW